MRVRGCPPMLLKLPPTKILPSACTAIGKSLNTAASAFGFHESAKPVKGSSRAILLRVCPPMLFAPLKPPPTRILPSVCTTTVLTVEFAFGSNESAKPVLASSRAMRLRGCPPMVVNKPPTTMLPSV